MTVLEPMWVVLAKYQPYANADGHGESWRRMCEERTVKAAELAWHDKNINNCHIVNAADVVEEAWAAALDFADAVRCFADAAKWSLKTIEKVEKAIRERGDVPS